MADMENKEMMTKEQNENDVSEVKESFFKKVGKKIKEVGVKVKDGVKEHGPKVLKGAALFGAGAVSAVLVVNGFKKHAAVNTNDEYDDLIDSTCEEVEEEAYEELTDNAVEVSEEEAMDEYPEE